LDVASITRDTSWEDLRNLAKRAEPSRGVREEFVHSIQQSLRVEGYLVGEAQIRRAVQAVVGTATSG